MGKMRRRGSGKENEAEEEDRRVVTAASPGHCSDAAPRAPGLPGERASRVYGAPAHRCPESRTGGWGGPRVGVGRQGSVGGKGYRDCGFVPIVPLWRVFRRSLPPCMVAHEQRGGCTALAWGSKVAHACSRIGSAWPAVAFFESPNVLFFWPLSALPDGSGR